VSVAINVEIHCQLPTITQGNFMSEPRHTNVLRKYNKTSREESAASTINQLHYSAQTDYWLVMIKELVEIAGYTYSRIARRINVAPSTIQKLATHPGRQPRQRIFYRLMSLYYKVFHGPFRSSEVIQYVEQQKYSVLEQIPEELLTKLQKKG
jgi:hypothetical protein